jgi:hypothetical protein
MENKFSRFYHKMRYTIPGYFQLAGIADPAGDEILFINENIFKKLELENLIIIFALHFCELFIKTIS